MMTRQKTEVISPLFSGKKRRPLKKKKMTKQNWSVLANGDAKPIISRYKILPVQKKKKKKVYIHVLLYFKRPIPTHHSSSLRTPSDNKAGLITPVIRVIKTPNDTLRWWCIEQSWDLLMEELWQQGWLVMTNMNPNKMQWVHLFCSWLDSKSIQV